MKKLIFIFLLTFLTVTNVYAVSPTPKSSPSPTQRASRTTPTPTLTQDAEQIEKIKDLVASKVAELKLVDKRGILGKVKNTSNSQISLVDIKNKELIIDIDELTKFEDEKDSFGISDIKDGDNISAVGLYNKETERLLARYISYATNIPENFDAVITERDDENFTLTVRDPNGKEKIIDVQTSTKTVSYEEGEAVKSGFSKTEVGERIIVVGFTDTKEPNQINASRIIRLPEIPLSPELKKAGEAKQITPTPKED
jgi:hypothetical protein